MKQFTKFNLGFKSKILFAILALSLTSSGYADRFPGLSGDPIECSDSSDCPGDYTCTDIRIFEDPDFPGSSVGVGTCVADESEEDSNNVFRLNTHGNRGT